MSLARRAVLGAAAGLALSGEARAAPPRRIVSLGSCLDVVLVNVADPSQIAALSHYAREPQGSTIAALARRYPFTWETAEEVIALRPDLVLATRYTPLALRNALHRLKVNTALFAVPESVAESLAQVREIAALVGHPQRGERLVARIDAALAEAAPPPGRRPLKALIFLRNGFASGRGTLMDEMLRRTGFENVAVRYGLTGSGNVPLERLLVDPPDVLLVGEATPGAPTWGDRVMTHPALEAVAGRMRQAPFPERLVYCGGPVLIQTAAVLAAAREGHA